MSESNEKVATYLLNPEGEKVATYLLKSSKGRYRWEDVIIPKFIRPIIRQKQAKDSTLDIRGLCYILESIGVIPKSIKDFDKVGRAVTRARKRGLINADAFVDNTRNIIKEFNDTYTSVSDQIDAALKYIKKLPNTAKDSLPRWYNQKYYVEVWVEKQTFANVLVTILRGRDVIIVPNRGWSSYTFLKNNIERLYDKFMENKTLHIEVLYFGDLDPSGWAMDTHYKKEFDYEFGVSRVQFRRVAIAKDQIETYGLKRLTNPDPIVIAKLRKNKNAPAFEKEFGSIFQIELEAIESSPEFEDMVRREVDKLYDKNKYQDVLNLPENNLTEQEIRETIVKRLKEVFKIE